MARTKSIPTPAELVQQGILSKPHLAVDWEEFQASYVTDKETVIEELLIRFGRTMDGISLATVTLEYMVTAWQCGHRGRRERRGGQAKKADRKAFVEHGEAASRPNRTQKTIARGELARLAFCNSKRLPHVINLDGERHQWVGIDWVNEGELRGDETRVV